MANACKLLNYVDPAGEFLTFYTELDSAYQVGEKVFIVGGNYDNTVYTDKTSDRYDPFNQYATGYTVIAIDNTDNSNGVVLNIPYSNSIFNSIGTDTLIFNPLDVYKTEEELLIDPNQIRESYISKTYFKKGEFNGGKFVEGIFGEYNIKGKSSDREYERQKFVDNLAIELDNFIERADDLDKIINYDYSQLESPSINNGAIFNNNYNNVPAEFTQGIFLGGDYNWGNGYSKYSNNKNGKLQTLNKNGGIRNLLDPSKFNIETFNDNNSGFGYTMVTSGNFGRIYNSENSHNITFNSINNKIEIDYIPYQLWNALDNDFLVQIKVNSEKNNKIFDVTGYENSTSGSYINISNISSYQLLEPESNYLNEEKIFDESGIFNVEIYVKDKVNVESESDKRNIFDTGIITNIDLFGGVQNNTHIQGGDMHNGEFREGRISSLYGRTYVNGGVINGRKDSTILEDIRWNDGIFLDGNWKGVFNIPLTDITIDSGNLSIRIDSKYKHLLKIGDDVFISYLKQNISNIYFDNYTDDPDVNLINFQTFNLSNIIENESLINTREVILILDGVVDNLSEINLQTARISQSHFTRGEWINGIWESGLRKVDNYLIESFEINSSDLTNRTIDLVLNDVNFIDWGDKVEVSNMNYVRNINIDYIPDFTGDERENIEYIQSIDQTLTVVGIDTDSNTVTVEYPELEDIPSDSTSGFYWNIDGSLKDIRFGIELNSKAELTNTIWENGTFKSGAWDGGIWRDGELISSLFLEPSNNQIQSVWQSGYWKNGTWDNGAYLSGVWQNGTWDNGVMTNLWKNTNINDDKLWDNGDSVWINGTFNGGRWNRGMFLNGTMNSGTIINGGIENIDWISGRYSNGYGEYSTEINTNRAGRLNDNNTYTNLSAPSVISVDGNGWIQLDQPSFYQKDYNIIFQDFDRFENPFNNEMFNIINRDTYGTRLQISYGSTSGCDNPIFEQDDFINNKPIISIDNLVDATEIVSNDTDNIYWLADSGHNRIIEVNSITNEVDVLGKIQGDSTKDKFDFSNIKNVATANRSNNIWVYVVDDKKIKAISKDKSVIFEIELSLNNTESIIDIQVLPFNSTINETVFVLTNESNLYYWVGDPSESFNKIETSLPNTISDQSFNILRGETTSTIQLLIKYNTENIYDIKHMVLDYDFSNLVYGIRLPEPMNFFNPVQINNEKIISMASANSEGFIKIWLVTENSEGLQNIYKYNYTSFFLNSANDVDILSDDGLNYNVTKLRMGMNDTDITLVGIDSDDPLNFAKSQLDKKSIGFGNISSPIRLLDIFQDLNVSGSTSGFSGYKYWYFDNLPERKQITYIDESLENLFDPLVDNDSIEDLNINILKMVTGSNSSEIFSIQRNIINNKYTIRRSNIGDDDTNHVIYNLTGIETIHDIVFVRNKLFMAISEPNSNQGNVVALSDFIDTNQNVVDLDYYNNGNVFNIQSLTSNDMIFDVIENGIDFLAMVWTGDGTISELNIDNTTYTKNTIYTGLDNVVDIALSSKNGSFDLFIATNNSIFRTISDKFVSIYNHHRWSKLISLESTNTENDKVFSATGINEIYRSNDNDKIIIRLGTKFSLFDTEYVTNDNEFSSTVIYSTDNEIYGLSEQRLIKASVSQPTEYEIVKHSISNNIGQYKQISNTSQYDISDIQTDDDFLLNNPFSLLLVEDFNNDGSVATIDDYLFFLDKVNDSDLTITRFYNIGSSVYGIANVANSGGSFIDVNVKDMTYDKSNRVIYRMRNDNGIDYLEQVTYSSFNSFNINPWLQLPNSATYDKICHLNIDNTPYIFTNELNGTSIYIANDTNGVIEIANLSSNIQANITKIEALLVGTKTTIFFQSGSILYSIENNLTSQAGLYDPMRWSPPVTVGNYNSIKDLTKFSPVNSDQLYDGDNVLVYESDQDDNYLELIKGSEIDTEEINIAGFSVYHSITKSPNDTVYYLYNDSLSLNKGVMRVFNDTTQASSINLFLNNQLDDITTGDYKKLKSINDTKAYALFTDGIYEYDFESGNVSLIEETPNVLTKISGTPISGYTHKPVDIFIYSEPSDKLAAIFEIYDNNDMPTGAYNIFVYDENSTESNIAWSQQDFLYMFGSLDANIGTDAIFNDGTIDSTTILENSTFSREIKHLFKSQIEPTGFMKNDNIFLYFGDSVATSNILKIYKEITEVDAIQNSIYSDIILRIKIDGFNYNHETINSFTIFPDPTNNNTSLSSTDITTGSFVIGGTDVLGTFPYNNPDSVVVRFPNTTSEPFVIGEDFKIKANITLGSSQITMDGSETTTSNITDGVKDFIVINEHVNSYYYDKVIIKNESSVIIDIDTHDVVTDKGARGFPIGYAITYRLVRPFLGRWIILLDPDVPDLNTSLYSSTKPIISTTLGLNRNINDNNPDSVVLKNLPPLEESYDFETIVSGYKVIDSSNDTLSPYITARVIYDTIIHKDVSFNTNGTKQTAHIVKTTWDNGLFVGTWDAPFYQDCKVIDGFSVFLNGRFQGDFHDGFFLGGTFENNGIFESNLFQGHFISDNNDILFDSGKVLSDTRYDIKEIRWEDNSFIIKTEGVVYDNGNYHNSIINKINKGSRIRIPNFINETSIDILNITQSRITFDGFNEVIIKTEKPTYFSKELWLNQKIFIQSVEFTEYLFGEYTVKHVFEDTEFLYLSIDSNFNEFTNGIYEPVIKPTIELSKYINVDEITTYQDNDDNWLSDIKISALVPSDFGDIRNKLSFVQSYYLKDYLQIMNSGDFIGYVNIPDYLQMFNFSFSKTFNSINNNFNSVASNMYLENIDSDDNTSLTTVRLKDTQSDIFARDIMVNNSYITTPIDRLNDSLENNIFLSGRTDRKWITGSWLNVDEKGFSNGESTFGSSDMSVEFNGEPIRIIEIFLEGVDFVWVELENIPIDLERYKYLNLRGFTGSKSILIGSEISNSFRVIEINDNFIKIKNPFKYYNGITTPSDYFKNFNLDQLQIRKQKMIQKSSDGINIRVKNSDILTLKDQEFTLPESQDSWYQEAILRDSNLNWTKKENSIKLEANFISLSRYYSQNYNFIKNTKYTIEFFNQVSGQGGYFFYIILDTDTNNEEIIYQQNTNDPDGVINFNFTPDRNFSKISLYIDSEGTSMEIYSFKLSYDISDTNKEFDYGYASVSSWNGGDFYGEFNSVWNRGTFKNGDFNGKWFGSHENYTWNGVVPLITEVVNSKFVTTINLENVSVKENDLINISFNSIFANSELNDITDSFYSNVSLNDSNQLVIERISDTFLEDGNYPVNITRYRVNNKFTDVENVLITDYNSNMGNTNNVNNHLILDYEINNPDQSSDNKVLNFSNQNYIATSDLLNTAINDGVENSFSIDLHFKFDNKTDILPILSFQDSKSGTVSGFKLHIELNKLVLEYKDDLDPNKKLTLYNNLDPDTWYHIGIFYDNGNLRTLLNSSDVKNHNIKWDIQKYDINFIAKTLLINIFGQIESVEYSGQLDEIRIWNEDVFDYFNTTLSNSLQNKKIINKYVSEIVAYYSGDDFLDQSNLYPEEEQYISFFDDKTEIIKEDNGEDFIYNNESVFFELDILADNKGFDEYKILTIEEERNLNRNFDAKYFVDLLLVDGSNEEFNGGFGTNQYTFKIRERLGVKNRSSTDLVTRTNFLMKDEIITEIKDFDQSVFGGYWKWANIILTDNALYIDGKKVGSYTLSNRNLFKYTNKTRVILGHYEILRNDDFPHDPITPDVTFKGFVDRINIWKRTQDKDEYLTYRIRSGENIENFSPSFLENNTNVTNGLEQANINVRGGIDGIFDDLVIPRFNDNGSQPWEHYIYASENYVLNPYGITETISIQDRNIGIPELDNSLNFVDTERLSTAMPSDEWLNGDDFKQLNTASLNNPFDPDTNETIKNNSTFPTIAIENMSDFRLFGKKIGQGSELGLNITTTGYVYFEKPIPSVPSELYPINNYMDFSEFPNYNTISTTDSISVLNAFWDCRSDHGGRIEYADRPTEFVLKYYGAFVTPDTDIRGNTLPPVSDVSETTNDYSFVALRIDKINSNILIYNRKIGSVISTSTYNDVIISQLNKYQGLRRTDSEWYHVNDPNRFSYRKTRNEATFGYNENEPDYVVGSIDTSIPNTEYSDTTEYILYVPRFDLKESENEFVTSLATDDFERLNDKFGIEILKTYNGKFLEQFDIIDSSEPKLSSVYMESLSEIKSFDNNDFINSNYNISEQFINTMTDNEVSRVSFFENGSFNSDIWHNGIFVSGEINVNSFIWKHGIKHNGIIKSDEELKNYTHWMGGFHLGENRNSFIENTIWYRGKWNGGTWNSGHWLSIDLDTLYDISKNDWSVWSGGEWYSKTQDVGTEATQTFLLDNDNFSNGLDSWTEIRPNEPNDVRWVEGNNSAIQINNGVAASTELSQQFDFVDGKEYRLRMRIKRLNHVNPSRLKIRFAGSDRDSFTSPSSINMTQSIGSSITTNDISNINNGVLENTGIDGDIIIDIKFILSFNSDPVEAIRIFSDLHLDSINNPSDASIEILYVYLADSDSEIFTEEDTTPYKIELHDSVWHGGTWNSDVIDGYEYTYQNDLFENYEVRDNNILQLPKVNSIWLGGLWLRGEFNGGIFANGFWNSVDCEFNNNSDYENSIKNDYNKNFSRWNKGLMLNSIWEGGIVEDSGDLLETVFGELTNLFSFINIGSDFVWDRDFKFKRSDNTNAYETILSKPIFTGYHLKEETTSDLIGNIELNRVRRQFNSDGIGSVYWRRGDWNNGLMQFSHWENSSLSYNSDTLTYVDGSAINEDENLNNSIFRSGYIYSSYWKGGLMYAQPTTDEYPLLLDIQEPNTLFYSSVWEKGYWKISDDGIDTDVTDGVKISDSLFSRSLWNAGVWEGGSMDLSIWRSGLSRKPENPINLTYRNNTVQLIEPENYSDLTFKTSEDVPLLSDISIDNTGSTYVGNIINDDTFIDQLDNGNVRNIGGVDNYASIWVNGCFNGSIWHGGIWQKGMLKHKDFKTGDRNFFNNSTVLNDYQVSVFIRGLWLSGYFSFYLDRNIEDNKQDNPLYGNNNEYLQTEFRKRHSLFMSISAGQATENNNIFGLSESLLSSISNDVLSRPIESIHNSASLFCRNMLKDINNITPSDYRLYLSIMNGSMLNGIVYENAVSTNENKSVFSINSSYGDLFYSIKDRINTNGNSAGLPIQKVRLTDFNEKIKMSNNTDYFIPYSGLVPIVWTGSTWRVVDTSFLSGRFNNNSPDPQDINIWRHNHPQLGDGTDLTNSNASVFNVNGEEIRVSIAQGCGLRWIPEEYGDEPKGEPRYILGGVGSNELGVIINTNDFGIDFNSDESNGTSDPSGDFS